ncbi:MAG TPA: serine hydrolase, partial [Lactococcus sp.]|nr:serine hydrolase [Lactococcus sp.]
TGTFILMNLEMKKAVIFLSNRVHLADNRAQWIVDRDVLIETLIQNLS